MVTTPDFMPVLGKGMHDNPKDGACIMEYVSLLAGEEFSDAPVCTHPVLRKLAVHVNDSIADESRPRIVPAIPRLIGTNRALTDEVEIEMFRHMAHAIVGRAVSISCCADCRVALSAAHRNLTDMLAPEHPFVQRTKARTVADSVKLWALPSTPMKLLQYAYQAFAREKASRASIDLEDLMDELMRGPRNSPIDAERDKQMVALLFDCLDIFEAVTGQKPEPLQVEAIERTMAAFA